MPPAPGVSLQPEFGHPDKPAANDVLVTPVREGAQDDWSRFEGASAAIGHFIRMVHEGRMSKDEGWEGICGYNAAMLRPQWPVERLTRESERLWSLHVEKYGPPLIRLDAQAPAPQETPAFTLGALLDDASPMPEDIIAPRVLTPGGLLVLGGAPKVGKSDLTISWLVHMAAGVPFLGFTPPRPLRIFYLQAEIQYHYLRERLKQIALPPEVLAAARDTFVATPEAEDAARHRGQRAGGARHPGGLRRCAGRHHLHRPDPQPLRRRAGWRWRKRQHRHDVLPQGTGRGAARLHQPRLRGDPGPPHQEAIEATGEGRSVPRAFRRQRAAGLLHLRD